MLDAIGFRWMIHNSSWYEHFEALKRYQAEHGHCNVNRDRRNNHQLENLVLKQRAEYELMLKGLPTGITQERIKLLESIGFDCE